MRHDETLYLLRRVAGASNPRGNRSNVGEQAPPDNDVVGIRGELGEVGEHGGDAKVEEG